VKRTLFICPCGSIEHSFVVSADENDAFLEIHLSPLPLWNRLRNAVGYLLGRRSQWGDFEEILLTPEMALDLGDRLIEWAQRENAVFQPNDVF
jgi:hypothetical protein